MENKPCKISDEDKKKFHEIMKTVWDEMPDELHDMIRSLLTQKKAVLTQIKEWADKNEQAELSRIIQLKIEKVDCKIQNKF